MKNIEIQNNMADEAEGSLLSLHFHSAIYTALYRWAGV